MPLSRSLFQRQCGQYHRKLGPIHQFDSIVRVSHLQHHIHSCGQAGAFCCSFCWSLECTYFVSTAFCCSPLMSPLFPTPRRANARLPCAVFFMFHILHAGKNKRRHLALALLLVDVFLFCTFCTWLCTASNPLPCTPFLHYPTIHILHVTKRKANSPWLLQY